MGKDSKLRALSPQTFAGADAKLCVGVCKALRWRLQSFALAVAMLCVFWGNPSSRFIMVFVFVFVIVIVFVFVFVFILS